MLSINDVTKIDDKRKQLRKEIYMKIYEQFSTKIKQIVELGHKQIFLTVPAFLLGCEVYCTTIFTWWFYCTTYK